MGVATSKSKQRGSIKRKPSRDESKRRKSSFGPDPRTSQSPPPPPPPPARGMSFSRQGQLFVALYDYLGRMESDLSFSKGDILDVFDNANSEWWKARHCATGRQGYVPSNYLAIQSTIEAEDWFHAGKSRKYCENILLRPGNPRGTFLIRPSETEKGSYSLSVRDCDTQKGDHVKHYKIRKLDNGGFYITPRLKFQNLLELVDHYKKLADGLTCQLTVACQKDGPPPPQDMNWEVPREAVRLIKILGKGNFGEVHSAKLYRTTDVAVKTLNAETCTPKAFLEEAELMKLLRHEKLVQLVGVCTKSDPIYIITEMMVNGSLLDYLRKGEGQKIGFNTMVDYAAQISCGMEYLEKNNYIHRDLAARNILVAENDIVKIADFGLARVINEDEYTAARGAKFPVKWTAPEAAMYGKFSIKSDVWSFGILLVEILTKGQVPYPGMSNREVLEQVDRGYRIPKPKDCPDEMYLKMLKCWAAVPEDRPTFEFLRSFFSDFSNNADSQYRDSDE